jgi:hypothetical protein
MSRCYFFGCWNTPGHYLVGPHGARVDHREGAKVELFGDQLHLDGSLAPRKYHPRYGTGLCWNAQSKPNGQRIEYQSEECPEGQFLRHVLPNGFTAIQWWDRCQGDSRGACNSTVLLEGEHTTEKMLEALRVNFPGVVENLKRGGVELVEVTG